MILKRCQHTREISNDLGLRILVDDVDPDLRLLPVGSRKINRTSFIQKEILEPGPWWVSSGGE